MSQSAFNICVETLKAKSNFIVKKLKVGLEMQSSNFSCDQTRGQFFIRLKNLFLNLDVSDDFAKKCSAIMSLQARQLNT